MRCGGRIIIVTLLCSNLWAPEIKCYPENSYLWTGYVVGHFFNKFDGDVIVYQRMPISSRGWMKFNTGSIPTGSEIIRVELHCYCSAVGGDSVVNLYSIENDPVTTEGTLLYQDCGDGGCYATGWRCRSGSWNVIELGGGASDTLAQRLALGWFGVGFVARERPDSVVFTGHGGFFGDEPYLVVTLIDTTPPRFTLTHPDAAKEGDSIHIVIAVDEELKAIPTLTISGISIAVSTDTVRNQYFGDFLVSGLAEGDHYFVVTGEDLSGNKGIDSSRISIIGPETVIDLAEIYLWPNPCDRSLYIHYHSYLRAKLKVEIFTLTAVKMIEHQFEVEPGETGDEEITTIDLDNGLYLYRVCAESEAGGVQEKVGRFAVVH